MSHHSVICIGELLIDFICTDIDVDLTEGTRFLKSAGGAPANVSATLSKLGGQAIFSGKVGHDPFGLFLKKTLEEVKVDTSMLVIDQTVPTTLAFVSLKENGERDFVFNRGADALLRLDDIDFNRVDAANILHFGSATALLSDPFYTTYMQVMERARDQEQFISFDPNYRGDLWREREVDFIDRAKKAIALSHLVKVSDEELSIISGEGDLNEGVAALHRLGARVVTVTLGKKGTFLSNGQVCQLIPSIPVKSIDSTGAGDAFVGATLFQLAQLNQPKDVLSQFEILEKMIDFSNKVGAMVCTKMGAIAALPTLEEVESWPNHG